MTRGSVVIVRLAAQTVDRSAYAIERILSPGDSGRKPMFNAFREGLHDFSYTKVATSPSNFGWPAATTPSVRGWWRNWALYRSI